MLFLKCFSNERYLFMACFFIQMSLTKTLRDIVRSCYEHFHQPHLLAEHTTKSTDDLESIKVVNNVDGSVMFISSDDVTILEDGSSTKVLFYFKLPVLCHTSRLIVNRGKHNT